jgi:hypothetical protein
MTLSSCKTQLSFATIGKKILVLEWGDNDPEKGSFFKTIPRAFVPGKSVVMTKLALPIVRAITTGGSSMIFCGTAFAPPIDMFKAFRNNRENPVFKPGQHGAGHRRRPGRGPVNRTGNHGKQNR